jgi:arylsulfatase A-like enzyme
MKRVILLLGVVLCLQSRGTEKPTLPNIVLIFMDDLGYGDLSCYGSLSYQTPNIDKIAAEGMRFTNFVSAQAVCSASRAALLTGCYPNRLGISGAFFPDVKKGINPAETTIAEMLKEKGYATGIFGKWHLGHHKEFLPLQHGFDEYLGIPYSNDMWPVDYDGNPLPESHWKGKLPVLPLIKDNEMIEEIRTLDDQAKLTTKLTEGAVKFINKNKNKPFFLYLPHPMPHVPIGVSEKFKGKSKSGLYGDLMMEIDWSVAEIWKTLKANNLDKNTLFIITSDNGPWLNYGNHAGSSGGFREGKGTSYEGGHRVPCIMYWKDVIPSGKVCNQLASTIDIFPTLAEITHAKLPDHKIDGINILEMIKGKTDQPIRRSFYYYYRKNSLEAVRWDHWKLVLPHKGRSYENQLPGNDGFPGKAPEDIPQKLALFDLRRDPAERYDVQELYPDMVVLLQKIAEEARGDLGDDLTERVGPNVRVGG